MYPELALALPFVFLGKMNFKMRLVFLCATLLTGGVLMGFHIGRASIHHEMNERSLHLRSRSNRKGGADAGVPGGQRSSAHAQAKMGGWRSNDTVDGLPVEDFKTKIAREAEEIMLRRGVKVLDQAQGEEGADKDFPPPIILTPRKHQSKPNIQSGQHAPGDMPGQPVNQNPRPPGRQPANEQAGELPPANRKQPHIQDKPKAQPPGGVVKEQPGIHHNPMSSNQQALEAAKHAAAASGRKQSIHYAYEPFDILPEPQPLDYVGIEPVDDVYGTELLPFKECIHLSVVVCGDRTEETLVMLKSAALLTKACLVFHIFAEDELQTGIRDQLNAWPESFRSRTHLYLYPITFPSTENKDHWKKVFKMCATQRLFLPELLPKVDALLYVDTDILFIRPLERIWDFFSRFNSSQMAALSPEHEVPNIGWYNRFARHPYYGKTGLNSGVMLMNLTRMREFRWINRVIPFYRQYQYKITWGDQDVINILFYFHPDKVLQYPCEWNYRPDHCMYGNNCPRIDTEGIAVIHGNRGVYHNEKQLPFRSIYETYRDFHFGGSISSDLIQPLKEKWMTSDLVNMYCTKAIKKPILTTLSELHTGI